jgi:hypothetical protein
MSLEHEVAVVACQAVRSEYERTFIKGMCDDTIPFFIFYSIRGCCRLLFLLCDFFCIACIGYGWKKEHTDNIPYH